MTKAEKAKLHRTLTEINKQLIALNSSLKIMGNMVSQLDIDVRNLFHVVKETQEQQRASAPRLRVIGNVRGPKTPRPNR